MWDLILAGRYLMIPITLCSLVGLAVFLERLSRPAAQPHRHPRDRQQRWRPCRADSDFSWPTRSASGSRSLRERRPRRPRPRGRHWEITRDVLQETGRQEAKSASRAT